MIDTRTEPTAAADAVRRRYDELTDLVASIAGRPPADPATIAAATVFVAAEARRLDLGAYDDWLDSLTDDVVLWVPLSRTAHPGRDQSLFLDDRRRLGERVAWRREPSAWGQQPASQCVRTVGSVEAWDDGDTTVVASAVAVHEHRAGRAQHLAGHQIHELVDGATRCRSKILLFPTLVNGLRNPSFLL
jgi:3-phenylpropionate/cinnamic acid dioxygenase small subunit